jgi:hypothetical protein
VATRRKQLNLLMEMKWCIYDPATVSFVSGGSGILGFDSKEQAENYAADHFEHRVQVVHKRIPKQERRSPKNW